MRKLLYTTTALVGAAFLMQAAPASAEVNLAARYNAKFVSSGDLDSKVDKVKNDLRSLQFSDSARVDFSASKDHPNGLTTGFFSRMTMDEGSSGFDDTYGSVAGSFGTVTMGSVGEAGDNLHVGGTPGTTHFGVGESTIFSAITGVKEIGISGAGIGTSATSSVIGRNQSVRYNSPSFTGFSFAFSYAPEVNGNKPGDNFDDDGDHNDGYSIGLAYTNEFGGTSISLSGAFAATDVNAADWKLAEKKVTTVAIPAGDAASTEDVGSRSYVDHAQFARIEVTGSQASIGTTAGDAKDARIGSIIELVRGNTLTAPAASADDSDALTTGYLRPGSTTVGQRGVTTLSKETDEKGNAFSFGAKVGYQDFSFGASYGQYEKGKVESTAWRLGGDYKVDAFTFGIGYGYKEIDEGGYVLQITGVGDGTPNGNVATDATNPVTQITEGRVFYDPKAVRHEEVSHLAFTVDYALGDGANIDFGISNYKGEKTGPMYDGASKTYLSEKVKHSGTGFGVGVTLSF